MQSIICPIDGTPCAPDCPDRFHDREEGGCLLTMLAEHSDAAFMLEEFRLVHQEAQEEGDEP